MTSLAGCSGEAFASILRSLGYQSQQRNGPAITVPLVPKASIEPITPAAVEAASQEAISSDPVAASIESGLETRLRLQMLFRTRP